MADDIYTKEAQTKYAKELALVETIAEHLVLSDAEVTVEAQAIDGLGFGKRPGAVIKFAVPEQIAAQQENVYRSSAEENATSFSKFFNANMVERKKDGTAVPFTMQDIAHGEGAEVRFDLGQLRGVLEQHAVADMLPKISEQYSVGHMTEKLAAQAPQIVQRELMQRKAEKQQKVMEDKILGACEAALENPDHLKELAQNDPQMAQNVQANLQQFSQIASQAAGNPELMDKLREESPRVAGLVEKIMEKSKEKAEGAEGPEKAEARAPQKKTSFVEAEQARAAERGKEGGAALG